MTIVGHSLTGAAIGVLAAPNAASKKRILLTLFCFAALAIVPDLRLPGWGHDRYDISHSLFSNLFWILLVFGLLLVWKRPRKFLGGWRVVLLGGLATVSHLILDGTYNHGHGVAVGWPFSDFRLKLTLPWFQTLSTPLPAVDGNTLRILGIELLFYGTLFSLALVCRWANRVVRILSASLVIAVFLFGFLPGMLLIDGPIGEEWLAASNGPISLEEARKQSKFPFPDSAERIQYFSRRHHIAFLDVIRFEAPVADCVKTAEQVTGLTGTPVTAIKQKFEPAFRPTMDAPWFQPTSIRTGWMFGGSGHHRPQCWVDGEAGIFYYLIHD